MDAPGRPHIRNYAGKLYIERVPGAWVYICDVDCAHKLSDAEMTFLVAHALKTERDGPLPTR